MAADTTLKSDIAKVLEKPTASTLLDAVQATPDTQNRLATYTCEDALETGDKIRIAKAYSGDVIIPAKIATIHDTGASGLTIDIGLYKVASDGGLGDAIDADNIVDGVDIAAADVTTGTSFPERPVTVDEQEVWIVAEVKSVSGSTASDETIDFVVPVNSAK